MFSQKLYYKTSKKKCVVVNCLINITEKLELIEAGKAGPVGNDPPSPRCSTPHSQQETTKTEYLMNDINVVDGSIQMDQSLPDISLQVKTLPFVKVCMLASSAVDHGFQPRSG
jgi:hypothetical protein